MSNKTKEDGAVIANPFLQSLLDILHDVSAEARSFLPGLSADQVRWKPAAKVWSISECFEHLIVTNRAYAEKIGPGIDQAEKINTASLAYQPRRLAVWFINQVRPEKTIKLKTFSTFTRGMSNANPNLLDDFLAQQAVMEDLIRGAATIDFNRTKISSPASRFLKFQVGEALELLVLHEQRHLLQAKGRSQLANFPQ